MKKIDFDYAFSPPHRVTVALPDSSNKLLCDAHEEGFNISWSDKAVKDVKIDGLFEPLPGSNTVKFFAKLDGQAPQAVSWRRYGGWIPALEYTFSWDGAEAVCVVVAGKTADIVRITARNTGNRAAKAVVGARFTSLFNHLWIERDCDFNVMTGNMKFSPRQIVLASPLHYRPSDIMNIENGWDLEPGQEQVGYIVRPYDAWRPDEEKICLNDWEAELNFGLSAWMGLIGSGSPVTLPDPELLNVYYACLADLFVMREPQKSGKIVGLCGTEVYRCTNACESLSISTVLSRLGFVDEALDMIGYSLDEILPDGNWNEPDKWSHEGWLNAGFKANVLMDYYRVSGDIGFLKDNFPKLLGSARYNESQRALTKNHPDPARRGLMPRGMGDGGLKDNGDMYGVFYTHNFLCFSALRLALEAAEILGEDCVGELSAMLEDFGAALLNSLELGAMTEPDGTRWIGGCPGNDGASRWGALDCVYPGQLLDIHHPLVDGTIAKLNRDISEGGLPMNLGWLNGGLWVAIAIDNLAVINMMRGDTQRVYDYLYASANHASRLITWCEERMPEKNSPVKSGDKQHLWTPLAFCRTVLHSLAFSDAKENALRLCWCLDKDWNGRKCGIENYNTFWGKVSFSQEDDAEGRHLLRAEFDGGLPPAVLLRGDTVSKITGASWTLRGDGFISVIPDTAAIEVTYK